MKARQFGLFLLLLIATGGRAAVAADRWVSIASPHFTLMTNGGEKEGRKILDQFERMRWVFQTLFPEATVDPAVPIVVIAAKDEKTFNGMEPAAYLARGSMKLGGYFLHSTDKNYILLRLDAEEEHPYASIYHEYTHVVVSSSGEVLPLWLNEGMAEFFQNTDFSGKDVKVGQPSPDDLRYLRDHSLVPLSVLLAVDRKSPYYHDEQKGSVFYAESWALTHMLMVTDRQKNLHRLQDYETLVQNHVDPVAAGEKAFGGLKQMDEELDEYIRQAAYMQFVLNSAAAPIDETAYKMGPVSQADADARRADVLACVERTDEARALAETVLKADPSNAQASETLGFLALRAGKLEEARKWYGEAATLGSQDFLTYFYLANFSIGQTQFPLGQTVSDGDESVENNLRKAIELNPRFAASYDRLAAYYARKHENLDEAHRLNAQAVQLEPTNVNYRMNAASVLMEMGQTDRALAVLNAAAAVATNPGDAGLVQARIQQLEHLRQANAAIEASKQQGAQGGKVEAVEIAGPAHPTVTTAAQAHGFEGVIRAVKCTNPYVIEFHVEGAAGKSVLVYNNNFTTIELSALGFNPPDSMNPCKDFEGMKAQVQYVESPDKTVDGQVTAVELKK